MQPKIYRPIEGLRGLLAGCVCLGHYGIGTLFESFHLQFQFHFAVDLFFIISGFVLSYANYYANEKTSMYYFAIKRIARLYPLHCFTFLIFCSIYFWEGNKIPLQSSFAHLFLIQNIGLFPANHDFNFPSWSISVELWSAIIFFFLTKNFKNRTSFLCIFLLSVVIFFNLLLPQVFMEGAYQTEVLYFFNQGFLRGLIGMSVGVLLFLCCQIKELRSLLFNRFLGYLSLLGLSFFCLFKLPIKMSLIFYFFSFIFVGSLISTPFLRILSSKILVWMGNISYSIYLLHIPLYCFLQAFGGNFFVKGYIGKCILLPILFLLSSFIYLFFEKPMQKWIQRLGHSFSNKTLSIAT